jgi:integrase
MSPYIFKSAFAQKIEEYLSFKESIGFEVGGSRRWYLCDFDRYCKEGELNEFNRKTVEGWIIALESRKPSVYRSWISFIRDFGRYLQMTCDPNAYVLSDSFKAKMIKADPYLLSQHEVNEFFRAAAVLEGARPWTWEAKCFFGLMHSCGLRTCEARKLAVADVNFSKQTLDILWSKGNRSRRLYFSDEVADMLLSCARKNERHFGADRPAFFVNAVGSPVTPVNAGKLFNKIWDAAKLPRMTGGKRPRPYSFRHHFAYANIERWAKEGINVDAMIPYLARYMGHSSFDSTYYYVHTSPDFMAEYADIIRSMGDILPEVGFDG